MKQIFRCWSLAVGLFASGLAMAVDTSVYAVVDQVQMPAWVERNGVRQPLEPGKSLQNRDRVMTGADARVVIQLAEGSVVKLGENAQLDLNALGRRESGVFTAALDVAKGAFRFTTNPVSKMRQQRAVNVRIATITAGIRGTDVWGQADAERDLVCLLEGRISVFHPQSEAREMSDPMSCYSAAKGSSPQPIDPVAPEQAVLWGRQTEVQTGQGSVLRGGLWKTELAVLAGEAAALELYDRARAAGYAARIKPSRAEGVYHYSIRVMQLPSREAAEALGQKLASVLELTAPKATRF